MSRKLVVEADGGSRGNPGPAGYGAVVLDADGETVLAEVFDGLGRATNNVAEYNGLIAGLAAALELGATEVDVRMDSKLVVEQMCGRWKVKHPAMVPLAQRARDLASEFDRIDYEWIPRARNSRADALANKAMDGGSSPTVASAPLGGATESSDPTGATTEALSRRDVVTAVAGPTVAPGRSSTDVAATAWTGQIGVPTRLILLRHGQTELSVHRRYSGHGDPELTELGQAQAAAAARALAERFTAEDVEVAAILTSPLRRARQTAAALAETTAAPLQVRDRLIETDFGGWEGLTFAEARDRDPDLHARWLGSSEMPPPGGESFASVGERVSAEKDAILGEFPGRTVVLVSHVTPIKLLLRDALGAGPSVLYRLHLDLASVNVAEFYPDGGASVRLVNDTSYLAGL
ncbi:bifunctional RNase H/acid phosphatase [Pseudonocardia sp. KRD291]|uniref:bifunctional RNase H/acid phosphatase n=1 Tax=Pseudonocardia sp. KRD291 TaxID=2792007 RepID=UPI0027E22324|nr:bifunctional RNase H/acid phosphatase [Pseudonocardia sp. KRD291]